MQVYHISYFSKVDPRECCGNCGNREEDDERAMKWHGCTNRSCQQWYHEECLHSREVELATLAIEAGNDIKKARKNKKTISDELRENSKWWCPLCKACKKKK